MTTENTALVAFEPKQLTKAFADPSEMEKLLGEIDQKVEAFEGDVTTVKGRKEIKSFAYKVTRSKTAIDNAGKDLAEEARNTVKAIDAERRKAREHCDELVDQIKEPLAEWERVEAVRIEMHEANLQGLETTLTLRAGLEEVAGDRARIQSSYDAVEDWEEFAQKAADRLADTMARLNDIQEFAEERAEQERAAEEARKAQEKADREAAEARKAQEAAEAKAREEARAREEAEVAARRAEEEKARAEREAQEAEERRAREAQEAKERAEREAQEAEARAKREAEEAAKAKAEQEARDRAAKEEEERRAKAAADRRNAEIETLAEIIFLAMYNANDVDVSLSDLAQAAAEAIHAHLNPIEVAA